MNKIIIGSVVILVAVFIIVGFVRKQSKTVASGVQQVTTKIVEESHFTQENVFGSFVTSSDEAVISAQVGGNIDKIYVREGDHVVKGQILAHISAPEITARYRGAETQVQISQEQEKQARRHWDDYKPEAREQFSLRTQQAEASRAEVGAILSKSRIVAPFDGIVSKKYITSGETVMVGKPIVYIVGDKATKEIAINVPLEVAEGITLGDTVFIRSNEHDGEGVVEAEVIAVSPVSDKFSRKVIIRAAFASETSVALGSFVDVVISDDVSVQGVKIPKEAIIKQYSDAFVFVVKENIARIQAVKILGEDGVDVIVSGLVNDDEIIVSGAHNIQSGDEVNVVSNF
ncbi:MAG TPA: efflux RND transporter periplasmic adaptor subunit [Candidatus Pacebacteria bacterium]|nr:efflux RND transporter periplasmic adaptor subunit [Candidatus Paceibacterota bacterium]